MSAPAVTPPPLQLVLGEEELLVERAVRAAFDTARLADPAAELTKARVADLTPPELAELVSPSLFAEGRVIERSGKDLREVGLLVGSGGVLRHGRPGVAERVFAGSVGEVDGGWQLPERAQVTVDQQYVLAAAGLLATEHGDAARRLVGHLARATS